MSGHNPCEGAACLDCKDEREEAALEATLKAQAACEHADIEDSTCLDCQKDMSEEIAAWIEAENGRRESYLEDRADERRLERKLKERA